MLTTAQLRALTQQVADEVRAGEHTWHADPDERWHVRLRSDDDVDVWLISWTTDQSTQLHDHGGSAGAFTVVEGTLEETVWRHSDDTLVDVARAGGQTVSFGPGYIHDVRNPNEPVALSVHAYSPPLTLMHYYDVDGDGVRHLASQWTDDPEAPLPSIPEAQPV